MNIQIFGKSKCFDTKKAERYFKERRVRFQFVDLMENLVDWDNPDAAILRYLAGEGDKLEKLLENPRLIRTPVVRNGRQATVGYCPDVWKTWE